MNIAYIAFVELDVANACVVHAREISEALARAGHDVTIFLPKPLTSQKWEKVKQVWIRLWGFGGIKEILFHIECLFKMIMLHRKRRFDLIYLRDMENNGIFPTVAKLLSVPLVIEVNGWVIDYMKIAGASISQIEKFRKRQQSDFETASGIIASTPGIAADIIRAYHVDKENVLIQELGANVELFKPGDQKASRRALELPQDGKIILFVGSFAPNHDLSTLLRAFKKVLADKKDADASLLLIGSGQQSGQVKRTVTELGLTNHVLLPGAIDYDKLGPWFKAADIGVNPLTMPNIKRRNGCMTLKLWDYMAAGLPVVSTDIPGTETYQFINDYGMPVQPGNPGEMAHAILTLLEDDALRSVLSTRSRNYVLQNRTWTKAARETEKLLINLARKK